MSDDRTEVPSQPEAEAAAQATPSAAVTNGLLRRLRTTIIDFWTRLRRQRTLVLATLAALLGGSIYLIVRQSSYTQEKADWFAGDAVALQLVAIIAAFVAALFAYPTFVEWRRQMRGPQVTVQVHYLNDGNKFERLTSGARLDQTNTGTLPTFEVEVRNSSDVALKDGRLSIYVQPGNLNVSSPFVGTQPFDTRASPLERVFGVAAIEEETLKGDLLTASCLCPPQGVSYFQHKIEFRTSPVGLRFSITASNLREPISERHEIEIAFR